MPLLRELDSATGTVIRASCRSAMRYEHDHPGSSIHDDVNVIDGNSRLAYAQLYDDEKGASAAEVLNRAMTFCRAPGSER